MKKTIMIIGGIVLMSFSTKVSVDNYLLKVAMDNTNNLIEWIEEDISKGLVNEESGKFYIKSLDQNLKCFDGIFNEQHNPTIE